jgi:hypothetical protein
MQGKIKATDEGFPQQTTHNSSITMVTYLPEFSSPFPFNFCTNFALLRRIEARSLEKDPLLFNLPYVI